MWRSKREREWELKIYVILSPSFIFSYFCLSISSPLSFGDPLTLVSLNIGTAVIIYDRQMWVTGSVGRSDEVIFNAVHERKPKVALILLADSFAPSFVRSFLLCFVFLKESRAKAQIGASQRRTIGLAFFFPFPCWLPPLWVVAISQETIRTLL